MPHRECRQQVLIGAPVQRVWGLVGDPNRHGEWWPTIVHSECEDVEQGCRYRGVVINPRGKQEDHEFTLERLAENREVLIRCPEIGTYTRFLLTEAQGGTFVDAECGIDPQSAGMHVVSVVAGRRILRRWLDSTIEGLEEAAVEREQGASM
jgi:hypothetical protein